ncbi:hypothetical protein K469DRAFT_670296 [Zopfia rhizophila CBS 207.26]|uniref:Uncharacterized protein n=1 Tax=Zopfia rhizophila CBS 207.26 TaxID=1314779 RepID=A0A6A6DSW9_9PEZI|nr:hypothetical protein K469DRAFT_670296 [Zopfia rhizophila CBS 207.26]
MTATGTSANATANATTEQAKQPPPPGTVALDNLQAMVNLVLIQSGRYITELQSGGGSGRVQFTMKRTIPAALDRFHDVLDDMENELHLAQAVLRRDLALLQADRLKREQAEAAERQRLAAESSAKMNRSEKKEQKDVVMTDVGEPKAAVQADNSGLQPSQTGEQAPITTTTAKAGPDPITTTSAPLPDPLFDGTPTTANPQEEFDFDAMFGPDPGETSTENINATSPNLDFTLEEPEPSLLRGLEDFAKGGDDSSAAQQVANLDLDFTMPDLPGDNNASGNTKPALTEPGGQQRPTEETQASTQDNTLDIMATDDLDDLFTFGYQPPEGTEFEDAFFGFGES